MRGEDKETKLAKALDCLSQARIDGLAESEIDAAFEMAAELLCYLIECAEKDE